MERMIYTRRIKRRNQGIRVKVLNFLLYQYVNFNYPEPSFRLFWQECTGLIYPWVLQILIFNGSFYLWFTLSWSSPQCSRSITKGVLDAPQPFSSGFTGWNGTCSPDYRIWSYFHTFPCDHRTKPFEEGPCLDKVWRTQIFPPKAWIKSFRTATSCPLPCPLCLPVSLPQGASCIMRVLNTFSKQLIIEYLFPSVLDESDVI